MKEPLLQEHLPLIMRSPLFEGMLPDEVTAVLGCMDARVQRFSKGSRLMHVGDVSSVMGMVLSGAVRVEREDYWGNRAIISSLETGQLFGEVYACEPGLALDVNVVAAHDAAVLFMDVRRIIVPCSSACAFHTRLSSNLLASIARRAYALTRKIDYLARRTTREKLLSYLSDQAKQAKSNTFTIPFNRQELADFLSVDRSAMSAELSKMRAEGLVDFTRNHFRLYGKTSDFIA